ncbi:MAG: hypothetical protein ACRCYP_01795 [Alphaproteobacteria bacterium]
MKLKKPLCAFFLAFFLGSSIKHPQDNKLYAKVALTSPLEELEAKPSGVAEKNSESFVGGNARSQAGSKSGSSIYATRENGANFGVNSPIWDSVASLGRFADFDPDPLPDSWNTSGKKTVLNLIPNEKINLSNALSWVDSHQRAKHLNHQLNHQSHDIGNAVEENLDSANLPSNKAEEDGLNEILNHPNLQFDSPKETLEEDIFSKPPTNRRSRNSSISSVWSDASLDWDASEQGATLSDCDYERSDEEDSGFASTSPLFGGISSPKAALEPFSGLDLTDLTPTKGGASTHYMNWGTGDLSDSEDESSPVIRKSSTPDQAFDWDHSVFNEVCEGSDEEDLSSSPLFGGSSSPTAGLEPFEGLDLTDLTPTKGGASTHYMNWGTGDLSDSEDESPPVIRKSSTPDQALTWDDAEQPLSFFNVYEEGDEKELDLDTEPLFKDAISREIAREPVESLGAEEKLSLQRALRLAQGAVPAEYMTLCYIDEKDFQRTTVRRHSSTQPDFPQKIVSRQFILRDPDFL